MSAEQRAKGLELFEDVMGFRPPETDEDPFLATTYDHLFANVWSRAGLTRRERRLLTLAVLVTLGHEGTLRLHLRAATRSGDLSDADIDEVILHLAHYAGWPCAAVASGVARQVRADEQP
jgi:4-carboxymuconolactone decarboxylase